MYVLSLRPGATTVHAVNPVHLYVRDTRKPLSQTDIPGAQLCNLPNKYVITHYTCHEHSLSHPAVHTWLVDHAPVARACFVFPPNVCCRRQRRVGAINACLTRRHATFLWAALLQYALLLSTSRPRCRNVINQEHREVSSMKTVSHVYWCTPCIGGKCEL